RHWQQAFGAELMGRLGISRIAARCTEAPQVAKRDEQPMGDHVREDWEIWTEPGFCVPFFVLRPIGISGRRPLVLTPHGHNKGGRFDYCGIDAAGYPRA